MRVYGDRKCCTVVISVATESMVNRICGDRGSVATHNRICPDPPTPVDRDDDDGKESASFDA